MFPEFHYNYRLFENFIETILADNGLKKVAKSGELKVFLKVTDTYPKLLLEDRCREESYFFEDEVGMSCHFNMIMYTNIFFEFFNELLNIAVRYKNEFYKISKECDIDQEFIDVDNYHIFLFLNDIYYINEKYIKIHLPNHVGAINKIKTELKRAYQGLYVSYLQTKHSINADYVLTGISLIEKQKFNRKPVLGDNFKEEVIYLDTNIISNILDKNDEDDKQLEKLINASKEKYRYCYSAYVIEDKIKQNIIFTKVTLDFIQRLTDGLVIYHDGDHPNQIERFAFEDTYTIFSRVKLWLFQTENAEDNEYNHIELSKLIFQYDDLSSFNQDKVIEFLKIKYADYINDKEKSVSNKIRFLIKMLNYHRFRIDKKKKKLVSSFQDNEHLAVAWKADYLITDDSKMMCRAKVIYEALGLKCKVLNKKELKYLLENST